MLEGCCSEGMCFFAIGCFWRGVVVSAMLGGWIDGQTGDLRPAQEERQLREAIEGAPLWGAAKMDRTRSPP